MSKRSRPIVPAHVVAVGVQLSFLDVLDSPAPPSRPLTPAMLAALRVAIMREGGNLLPIAGLRAAAESALVLALIGRGLAAPGIGDAGPVVTAAGRVAVAHADARA